MSFEEKKKWTAGSENTPSLLCNICLLITKYKLIVNTSFVSSYVSKLYGVLSALEKHAVRSGHACL